MQLPFHPAPGLGDILPGWYALPQNPIVNPVTYRPGMGEILPGAYVLPHNPLADRLYADSPIRPVNSPNPEGDVVPASGGCGCASCAGGMGELDLGSLMQTLNPGYVVGGIIAAFLIFRKK